MSNNDSISDEEHAKKIRADWDRRHPSILLSGVPSALYTDENPATTIKGTGFRNGDIAKRTIILTSQPGARYKQYWTIRAMRERAAHHQHQTSGMREAIAVFDVWLNSYRAPTAEERKEQETEWRRHRDLCNSLANAHAYGKNPSKEEMRRAREDLKEGQNLLSTLLSQHRSSPMKFPLTAFTALFGGPGIHGYGTHNVDGNSSRIVINEGGPRELLGNKITRIQMLIKMSKEIVINYNRINELASAKMEVQSRNVKLEDLWRRNSGDEARRSSCESSDAKDANYVTKTNGKISQKLEPLSPSWTCSACTFIHVGKTKLEFLTCEICGTAKPSKIDESTKSVGTIRTTMPVKRKHPTVSSNPSLKRLLSWGCLRSPTKKDIEGPSKRRKGLDQPPPVMDFLVVLDFEWTADDKRKMEPVSEITQFPSVAMRLTKGNAASKNVNNYSLPMDDRIPPDLKRPSKTNKVDAICISMFDSFVRPTLNPTLTPFSIELTGITQDMVDAAPTIDEILMKYINWLRTLGLIDGRGNRIGNWAFVTWGDSDIMSTLRLELLYKSIDLPPCLNCWINLKDDAIFKRHYRRKPKGGLRACVESVGATWEGRAHNGLIDSINTAKIVKNMVQTGFRFVRSTRGLDRNGTPFGAA